ncbi:prolipoprotein diacylglyceryl transferase [Alteromonadaceae bacterium M269]|nr:prolipoprotein diacylglyceryl transferase [Alteromonadaceae bacterium M269]
MAGSYLTFPEISAEIFTIGPISLRWYGLMYLIAFAAAWFLANKRLATHTKWNEEQLSDLLFQGFLGVIIGGRVGYVLFYHFDLFLADPLYLFKIWEGGMSFHGGLLGVVTALWLFARKQKVSLFVVGDFVAPLVPLGLGFGRLGNFINAELWGRKTDVPWAFVFPGAGPDPRHPSQLYEAFLEGFVLFIILWYFSKLSRPVGAVSGLFLIGYGSFRFIVEYFREPDAHLVNAALADFISRGQLLSLPMIIAGLVIFTLAYRRRL